MNRSLPCLALLCLGVPTARADKTAAPPPAAPLAFERLGRLVGTWVAPLAGGKEIKLSYRFMSSGSALVETYTTTSGKESLTVFHVDGPRLLATHYCAQGNQPRLKLVSDAGASRLVFEFTDATNLPSPQSSHLHKLEIGFTDEDHITVAETYREMSKDSTQTLRLTRKQIGVANSGGSPAPAPAPASAASAAEPSESGDSGD